MTPVRFFKVTLLSVFWFARTTVSFLRQARRGAASDPNLLHRFGQELARGWTPILGLRVMVRNQERLTSFQPCVYLANHRSNLDIPTLAGVLPPRSVVIVKRELLKVPFFGKMLVAAQCIVIDRNDRADSQAGIDLAAKAIAQEKLSIWVFPEGTRNHGRPLPFKKGAFHLARKAGVKLVPMVHAPVPKWVDGRRLFVRPQTDVVVEVLEPVDPLAFENVKECIAFTQRTMLEALTRLEAEMAERV